MGVEGVKPESGMLAAGGKGAQEVRGVGHLGHTFSYNVSSEGPIHVSNAVTIINKCVIYLKFAKRVL